MNKARAYRQLKKRQSRLGQVWTELTPYAPSPAVRLEARLLELIEIDQSEPTDEDSRATTDGDSMFHTRIHKQGSEEKINLPSLRASTGHASYIRPSKTLIKPRPVTSSDGGYTLLQAKLDAIMLPNPGKRKANDSVGFKGKTSSD